jgi:hypothetical protein
VVCKALGRARARTAIGMGGTLVIRSLMANMTAHDVIILWKVTRSTRPARTSRGDDKACSFT